MNCVLNVAVTGPTGEIGRPLLAALERAPGVGRVIGMARGAFDPAAHGWKKVEYLRGDILDRGAVEALVAEADVVVHLAFVIVAGRGKSREINLDGSRNVFEAAVAAGVKRLVYTSSVAAYGFDRDSTGLLSEDDPARGSERHPYSADKAAVEVVLADALAGSETDAYVFRPCIVGGRQAPLLLELVPLLALARKLPGPLRRALDYVPVLKPILPDPGVPFQLVHHDDVAAALGAAVIGAGEPGVYNLAGPGQLTISDLARGLGWHSLPLPKLALAATAELVSRLPLPAEAAWIEVLRWPVLMDTGRARCLLDWQPRFGAEETLRQTIAAARSRDGQESPS
jgi:nucleoside-diphosphate-sugar epimerase